MECFSLHEHPEYKVACAELMNEEWPRSITARIHSLEKSCDSLPYNIVLVDAMTDPPTVLGHSRITPVIGITSACFVESVVVKKSRRGHGLGRKIMEQTEILAKRLGFDTMYLTTHDKQDFYAHLGYDFCDPIITAGSGAGLLNKCLNNQLLKSLEKHTSRLLDVPNVQNCERDCAKTDTAIKLCTESMSDMNFINSEDSNSEDKEENTNLTYLSKGTPPPTPLSEPPPPPPPPPTPTKSSLPSSPLHKESVIQTSLTQMSWMKKLMKQI